MAAGLWTTVATRAALIEGAATLGREAGTAAGSWVVDGNTTDAAARAILAAFEDCDFDIPSPLSGEMADSMTPRDLYEAVTGRDAHADASWDTDGYHELVGDLCDAFEDAYYVAFEAEATSAARYVLGLDVFGHEIGDGA